MLLVAAVILFFSLSLSCHSSAESLMYPQAGRGCDVGQYRKPNDSTFMANPLVLEIIFIPSVLLFRNIARI